MTTEQLSREIDFGASMCIADRLQSQGLITDDEHFKIKQTFLDKHEPLLAGSDRKPPAAEEGAEPLYCQPKKP